MSQPEVRELNPSFGAEIIGLDLTRPLDNVTVQHLRNVFDERGVLLFRDTSLDRVRQYALCEVLRGSDLPNDEEAVAGAAVQQRFYTSNRLPNVSAPIGSLVFHADGMWTDEPFEALSLYAEEVEPPVAPTMFASAVRGWEALPDEIKEQLDGLDAVQVGGPEGLPERRRARFGSDVMQTVRDGAPEFVLPVARRHPRTGRTTPLISANHAKEIVGLSADESDELLDAVFDCLYSDANVYAHEWQNQDLVVWDNIAIHHARPNVTREGPVRTLRKVGLPLPTSKALTEVRSYQIAQ